MREFVLIGGLLVVLGMGVVQSQRSGPDGGLVERLARPAEAAPDASAAAVDPAPTAAHARPAAPSVLAAGELSVVDGPDGPDASTPPMVRFFDDAGALHMVRGFDRVPPAYREDAVAVGGDRVNIVRVPAPGAAAFRDWQPEPNGNRSDVVLFSAPWCGACKRAKRHLDRRGVAYEERDVESDADAEAQVRKVLGRVAIPLLEVDGRFISGFRPDVYDRALGG